MDIQEEIKKKLLKQIAEKLVKKRRELGWTQEELAKRTALGIKTIANYESGTKEPRLSNLIIISNVLGVPLSYFLEDFLKKPKKKDEKYEYICQKISEYEIVKNDVYKYLKAVFNRDESRLQEIIDSLIDFKDTMEKLRLFPADPERYIFVIKDGEIIYFPREDKAEDEEDEDED